MTIAGFYERLGSILGQLKIDSLVPAAWSLESFDPKPACPTARPHQTFGNRYDDFNTREK